MAWFCLALLGLAWPCLTWPGLALHCISLPGLALPGMGMHCLALPCLALPWCTCTRLTWPGLVWNFFFNPASLGLACSGVDFLGMSGLALRFLLIP